MTENMIQKIKDYAIKKHNLPSDCQRYGNQPYSKHLEDVVETAARYINYINESDREDVICASWGHDLLEDTATSPSDIEKLFNHRVADIILRVSNERGWNRKERNFKTYQKIWQSELATFVKICDRIANTKNSKESGHDMFKVYREEYPVFKYALKGKKKLYSDMWKELDDLNDVSTMDCFTLKDMKDAFESGCEVYYDDNDGRTTMAQTVVDTAFNNFINNRPKQ